MPRAQIRSIFIECGASQCFGEQGQHQSRPPPNRRDRRDSVKSSAIAVAARSQVTRGLLRPITCRAPINPIDPSVNHGPPSIKAPQQRGDCWADNRIAAVVMLPSGNRGRRRSG